MIEMVAMAPIWWLLDGFGFTIYAEYGLKFDFWLKIYEAKFKFQIEIVVITRFWWPPNGFAPTHEIELSLELIFKSRIT
jgi:hypothetical protein